MFYTQLKKACEENDINVTALIKELEISTGSMSNWKKGVTPTGEIIMKISERLQVSADFLLGQSDIDLRNVKLDSKIRLLPFAMLNTPPRIASLMNGKSISDETYNLISAYLGCSLPFLFGVTNDYNPDKNRTLNANAYIEIVEILDCCADNDNYKILQNQISYIIIMNLVAKKIKKDVLYDLGLSSAILDGLFLKIENPAHLIKQGFNISDLYKIRRRLAEKGIAVSIQEMLTGVGE